MVALITDPQLEAALIASRRESGADKFDEVWEGVYVMSPLANNEHQSIVSQLTTVLNVTVAWPGLGQVFPGVNISDRTDDWKQNFRCPDVAVFLQGTQAEDRGAYWYGGPDFAIEVTSPGERVQDKLPFYAAVGTRELLVIDRSPWRMSLYRLRGDQMEPSGAIHLPDGGQLNSHVLPLSFVLESSPDRTLMEIHHSSQEQRWRIQAVR